MTRVRLNKRICVPFEGTPPPVKAGDRVEILDTSTDRWLPAVAASEPRYDHEHAIGKTYLTVAVEMPEPHRSLGDVLNWPAEAVRLAQPRETP